MTACGNGGPLSTPVTWWHDLEGGEIAAQRPPPPGADLPYPKLGTVPARPILPAPAFRQSLQAQLAAERDRRQRIAADTPIVVVPAPAVPKTAPAPGANAQAMLETAESPAAPPPAPAKPAVTPADPTPMPGVAVADASALPPIPDAPPAPASFEGVPAEPVPTPPPPVPRRTLTGTQLLFPTGLAMLPPSQMTTLKDIAARRGKQSVDITGLGEAQSDTPDGQKAAIDLGLARAEAVAQSLAALHVPQDRLRLGADAFGRGALVRLIP